jgi:iron complex outermembrane recepter protein
VIPARHARRSRALPPGAFRRFNSSPEVIRLVVLMYVRFPLSLRNVEDLLFERGIDGLVQARQVRDTPGGYLQGLKFNYQQDLTFLPGLLRNFGVQFNFMLLDSEFQYLIDPGSITPGSGVVTRPPTWAPGPWLGSSPRAYNATLYYETKRLRTRVSVAKRDDYNKRYPVGVGSCDPGRQANGAACNPPLINEFVSNAGTTNVDFSFNCQVFKDFSVTVEALNLTNEVGREYAYSDPVLTSYGASGRNVRVGMRYRF